MAFLLSICAIIFIFKIPEPGECLVKQAFFHVQKQRYLANHIIGTKQAASQLDCSMHCVADGSCVSVNFKTTGIGKGRCELNDKTLEELSNADGDTQNPEFNYLYIISTKHPEEKLPESCSALLINFPTTPSRMYSINPQGLSSSPMVQVYCDMTSKNGIGVTVIGHDSESRTLVKGYYSAGSYQRNITYDISMEQIVAIMNQSKNCEQFIKYECYHSILLRDPYGWWVSRQGSQMNYWGGAAVNSGKCACGMTNSCADGGKCNCDKNDVTWREDSGYLTDKNTLPVTELIFGDTGTFKYGDIDERGYHTLGKLRCWN